MQFIKEQDVHPPQTTQTEVDRSCTLNEDGPIPKDLLYGELVVACRQT